MKVYVVTGSFITSGFFADAGSYQTIIGVFKSKEEAQDVLSKTKDYVVTEEEDEKYDWTGDGYNIGNEFEYEDVTITEVELDKLENILIS